MHDNQQVAKGQLLFRIDAERYRLALAQAEAVADLIDAASEAAVRSAVRSLRGEFSAQVQNLSAQLVDLRMLIEATLDFPEEDIDFIEQSDARGQLERLRDHVAQTLRRSQQGAVLRDGLRVVIAGQPNAGKSSLLNALAGVERAIVTPLAGTTRDTLTETLSIDGVPLHLIDTAGLRDLADAAVDVVEQIGIERAWQQIEQADAVVVAAAAGDRVFLGAAQAGQRLAGVQQADGGVLHHAIARADLVADHLAEFLLLGVGHREIADVVGLLDDRSGIPHVQFMVRIERQHSTHKAGLRTLSVTSFLKYYNERI